MRALTPVERRTEHRLRELDDFAGMWEATQLLLAEDELLIDADFEATLTAAPKSQLDHDGSPGPQHLSRQTDGLLEIVSRNAVLDGDAMLGIEHDRRPL
jgi:hypothetical protein